MSVAVIFPGQGTQGAAMGAPWRGHAAWAVVERAEAAFGLLVQAATSLVAYGFERMLRNAWAAEKAGSPKPANMEEGLFRLDKSLHRN